MFSGVLEYMPVETRVERLQTYTGVLVSVVNEHGGSLLLTEALWMVAARLHVAVSEVKRAVHYALSNDIIRLNSGDMLTVSNI